MKKYAGYLKRIVPVVGAVLFFTALRIFWGEIRHMSARELKTAFYDIPRLSLFLSGSSVAFSYWLTTLIEKYAVEDSGLVMRYPKIARISFISRAVGAAAGVLISGASFRYRYYSRAKAKPMQIARIVALTQVTTWAGAGLLNGLVLLFWPEDITSLTGVPASLRGLLAAGCIVCPVFLALVSLVVKNRQYITIHGYAVAVPKPGTMLRQLSAGFFIPSAAAMSLFALLPASHGVGFPVFCGVVALSSMVGAVSMVPAGIGVFDASLVLMLHPFYNSTELLSALLFYRLFNNLVPFAVSAVLLIFDSFRPRHL